MLRQLSHDDRIRFYERIMESFPKELTGLITPEYCVDKISIMTIEMAPIFYSWRAFIIARDEWVQKTFAAMPEPKENMRAYRASEVTYDEFQAENSRLYKEILEGSEIQRLSNEFEAKEGPL